MLSHTWLVSARLMFPRTQALSRVFLRPSRCNLCPPKHRKIRQFSHRKRLLLPLDRRPQPLLRPPRELLKLPPLKYQHQQAHQLRQPRPRRLSQSQRPSPYPAQQAAAASAKSATARCRSPPLPGQRKAALPPLSSIPLLLCPKSALPPRTPLLAWLLVPQPQHLHQSPVSLRLLEPPLAVVHLSCHQQVVLKHLREPPPRPARTASYSRLSLLLLVLLLLHR